VETSRAEGEFTDLLDLHSVGMFNEAVKVITLATWLVDALYVNHPFKTILCGRAGLSTSLLTYFPLDRAHGYSHAQFMKV
jgi:hypothetical protein